MGHRYDEVKYHKKTGAQAPLDISDQLAKIIGTAKREQVSDLQVIKKLWACFQHGEDRV